MFDNVTKDGKELLTILYKEFLTRRKSGKSKFDAALFGGSETIQKSLLQNKLPEDVDAACRELHQLGYLDCAFYDDMADEVILTDKAISDMEHRFQNGLADVIKFIQGFI